MRSAETVFVTAMSSMSSGFLAERCAAEIIRPWTRATFSTIDIVETARFAHMIAVGGAGSFGSPAAVMGNRIINSAKAPITTIPTTYDG